MAGPPEGRQRSLPVTVVGLPDVGDPRGER
jgi:hypothetical protein